MEINDIIYGNPIKNDVLSWQKGETGKIFDKVKESGIIDEFIKKYPFPKNDSEETIRELKYLEKLGKNLSEKDIKFCEFLEKDLHLFFSLYLKKLNINESRDVLKYESEKWLGIIDYLKQKFNRARPYQLAFAHKIPLYPNIATDASCSAYPSGHTFEFLILINYLTKKYPNKKEKFIDLYKKIRNVRELSGVHYPSDTNGSEILFKMLKDKKIIN